MKHKKMQIDLQKHALAALSEWSKWLVAIQTALVGGIVWLFRLNTPTDCIDKILVMLSVFSFVASAFCALWLVGTIPQAIQQLPFSHPIHQYSHRWNIKLIHFAGTQHTLLAVGLVLLLIFGVRRLYAGT